MTINEQIVTEAKTWIGTPYKDHASLKYCGADCAGFPCKVYQSVGLVPTGFKMPKYSPQAWLNSPAEKDKMKLRVVDTTFLDVVLMFAHEIQEAEIQPGDLVLYKVVNSWTHGAIVIEWPNHILHAVKTRGVIGSHGTKEGFLVNRPRRYFRFYE